MTLVMRVHLFVLLGAFQLASSTTYRTINCPQRSIDELSMKDVQAESPIVVSGADISHGESDLVAGPNNQYYDNYTFEVSCVFKSGKLATIPRTIYIIGVGDVPCGGTTMVEGESYIVVLKKATAADLGKNGYNKDLEDSDLSSHFIVLEANKETSSAFEVTDQTLSTASMICGMDDKIVSLGQGNIGDHLCPTRNVTSERCMDLFSGMTPLTANYASVMFAAVLAIALGASHFSYQ